LAIASVFVRFCVAAGVSAKLGRDRLSREIFGSNALAVSWTRRGPELLPLMMGGALQGATVLTALRKATEGALCIMTWGALGLAAVSLGALRAATFVMVAGASRGSFR
jgi:hypothetical protein